MHARKQNVKTFFVLKIFCLLFCSFHQCFSYSKQMLIFGVSLLLHRCSRISRSVTFINAIPQIILSQTYRYQVGDVKFCATSKFSVSLPGEHKDSTDRVVTLKTEVVLTCVHGTWAGLVQLHALSSVLKCTIFSVYPKQLIT